MATYEETVRRLAILRTIQSALIDLGHLRMASLLGTVISELRNDMDAPEQSWVPPDDE